MKKTDFVSRKTFHQLMVEKVYRFLIKESNSRIVCNTPSREKRFWTKLKLITGEYIYPDIVDFGKKFAYEIHIIGERRREYFDKLTDSWTGVNVFIEEKSPPETLVMKVGYLGTFLVKRIQWQVRRKEKYIEREKPIISWISEKIAKDENLEVDIEGFAKQIGLLNEDTEELVDGLMYVLFYNGYYVNINGKKMIIRKKKEGDKLPDYLPEIMETLEEITENSV